ncbi:DUF433 domain-containing protein [Kamptonema formosum]|uniref:DUF433 domain-containing protein n=1 Tax=Kamptonema formosum TaxID=331992 RepID=UPI00034C4B17|nr:DUF433 domain-containing protein [Oscillatoria sp. PCC 10802]
MTVSTPTDYKHIQLDERNVPFIAGTTMKVVELITSVHAYGWSPEELHFQYPHITLSQIHSALAYYWEHKEEIDADMKRREEYAEKLQKEAGESPFAARLRAQGLLK